MIVKDELLKRSSDRLRLSDTELNKLWKIFSKYDKDKSGEISLDEFYYLIGEKKSYLGQKVFELVDIDVSEQVNFSEFVSLLTRFCLLRPIDIVKFCFNIFDDDKNGYIEHGELRNLVELLHQEENTNNELALKLIKDMTNEDGKIDFKEFEELNRQFPFLLFPAFKMQQSLMEVTFGQSWWIKKREDLTQVDSTDEKLREKQRRRQAYKDKRRVQMEMGVLSYYMCFWKRAEAKRKVDHKQAVRKARQERREAKNKDFSKLYVDGSKTIIETDSNPLIASNNPQDIISQLKERKEKRSVFLEKY